MPPKSKSNIAQKYVVRCALIASATVATFLDAQTIAFNEKAVVAAQSQDQTDIIVPSATALLQDQQTLATVTPTSTPPPTNTLINTPTTVTEYPSKQSIVATATATVVKTSTKQPTVTATKVPTATKIPTKAVVAAQQPRPQSRSSR